MAMAAAKLNTAPGYAVARGMISDAAQLKQQLPISGQSAQRQPFFQPMTEEEWEAKYAYQP